MACSDLQIAEVRLYNGGGQISSLEESVNNLPLWL